jgi:hypothetical protein
MAAKTIAEILILLELFISPSNRLRPTARTLIRIIYRRPCYSLLIIKTKVPNNATEFRVLCGGIATSKKRSPC